MIECDKCKAKYPTPRLFCGKCKERLGVRCAACGFINLLDDRFCGLCLSDLKLPTQNSMERQAEAAEEVISSRNSLYDEILREIPEDEAFIVADEKIAQEEIDDIFQDQKDEEL